MEDPVSDHPPLVPGVVVEMESVEDVIPTPYDYGRRTGVVRRLVGRVQELLEGKPWKQFFAAFAFYLSSAFVMSFALNFVHYRMPDPTKNPALPDILHDLIPIQQKTAVSELLFHFMTFLTIGSGFWYYRLSFWPYGTRYMMAWGSAWYIRVIALLATSLPPTEAPHCRYDYPNYPNDFPHPIPNIWWNTLMGIVSGGNGNIHCGDLLFSGHSVVVMVNWLFMITYVRHNVLLAVLSTLMTFVKIFLIIVERNHYTIDVLVSMYVTATVWHMTPEHIPFWLAAPFEAVGGLIRRLRKHRSDEPSLDS